MTPPSRRPGGEWEGRAPVRYLYIAGKWTGAADDGTSQTINPYDATPLETLAEASAADVNAAVAAAREAFDEGPWRRSTVTERAALLGKIAPAAAGPRATGAHREPGHRQDAERGAGRRGRHHGRVPVLRRPGGHRRGPGGRPGTAAGDQPDHARAGRRVRPHRTVELPAAADLLEARAGAGRREHHRDQAQRADPPVHGGPGRPVRGGGPPAGRAEPAARPGRHGRAGAGGAPGRGPDLVHRRPGHRREDHGRGGTGSAARSPRARRQEPQHRVRRHRLRHRGGQRAHRGVPAFGPGMLGLAPG